MLLYDSTVIVCILIRSLRSSFCLQSGHTHKVTQLQLGSWTPEGLCTSPKTIVEVADLLFAVQRKSGNKSVVVHGR